MCDRRMGQAMLESFLVILLVSLLLFGLLQVAVVFNAHEILHHSAARAARARTVGFNTWMVRKAQRVAAIPNSGRMLEPIVAPSLPLLHPNRTPGRNWDDALDTRRPLPTSERTLTERARIPEYLASGNPLRASYILDYAEWNHGSFEISEAGSTTGGSAADILELQVRQWFPLAIPLHRAFHAPSTALDGTDRISLSGRSELIRHYTLYLEDHNW